MSRPDWILVQTSDVRVIQEQLLGYEELYERVSPRSHLVTARLDAQGFYAVTFEPAVKRLEFLNMVGHLFDHHEVLRTVGWVTEGGTRYGLEPDRARLTPNSESEYLIGCSESGMFVEACLSDGAVEIIETPRQGERIDEPRVSVAGDPALRFLVVLET